MRLPTLRYLLSAGAIPATAVGLGAAMFVGPWSPLALDRANAAYVAGRLPEALVHYQAAAEGWHTPATRADAAERAALIHIQQGDATQAARDLRRAAELSPSSARRGAIRTQLGTLYLHDLDDPLRAAETFEQAEIDRGDGEAALSAARAWERADRPARALEAYQSAMQRLPSEERDQATAGIDRVAMLLRGASASSEPPRAAEPHAPAAASPFARAKVAPARSPR